MTSASPTVGLRPPGEILSATRAGWRQGIGLVGWVVLVTACGDAGPETALQIESPPSSEIIVGETLSLSVTATGDVPAVAWSSSDPSVAEVAAGTVEAFRPGETVVTASAPGVVSDEIAVTVVPRSGGYSAEEVDYFTEIAFGSEFGGATPFLRRWRAGSGPLIRVNGSPTAADMEVVDSVLAEINRLAPVDVERVTDFPTVEMHVVPQSRFAEILPEAPSGNVGLVWLWWDADQYLTQSVVLISTDITESLRAHVIREELTQMLGLLQDSYQYPESIFYQRYSEVTEYLPIDRAVIELLYRPELRVGMTSMEAARAARLLVRASAEAAGTPQRATGRRFGSSPGPLDARGSPGQGGSGDGPVSPSRSRLRRAPSGASR